MPSESNLHECARAGGIKMRGFPLRKIKRNGKYLLFGAVLVVVGVAAYLEYVAMNTWNNVATEDILQKAQTTPYEKIAIQDRVSSEDIIWSSKFIPQPWRPTYKGKANLHVFEDWCGSSVASLRKNLHFPLYPHSRITVKKLAVAPNWKNYGLRIFGYIHPYISGEFLFAVACSGNCEFWLSRNENPEELQLYTYVGKTGEEWSAPGEYGKYASQISTPVLLQLEKRFYFELIYKQNDRVNDHVEVAWRLNKAKTQFKLIDSNSLSLYTDESSMKMSEVRHIPHMTAPKEQTQTQQHRVEMLREDPRDTFFKIPLLDRSRLWGVLPECSYKPRKMVRGRTISRYQGLQFVRLTYVYPNDYTRLTHMESDNTCFYQLKPDYLKLFGFSHYMKLQQLEDVMVKDDDYRVIGREEAKHEMQDEKDFEYHEDDIQHQERKLTSTHTGEDFGKRGGVDDAEGWPMYGDLDLEGGAASDAMYDREIIWDQNFHVNHTDFQLLRTDWIDLNCNVSGNLMIGQSEVMPVVQAFMNKLELKFPRTFSLQRVVNVEKRVYEGGGSRYLLELELMEESRRRVRLVHYVNTLKTRKRMKAELCNTHTFLWNPEAIIHIIVPVRNQARWVQKFIVDMENLYQLTGDKNINIIITDYSSTDMDIKEALKNAHLPRFQYLRLTGSFERSAGLQAGIDLIRDTHSIVFLCDLHIHFPPSFFDSLRKHCVEGHVVFAPLVMRLKCGATPEEPDGYWEVNGFGLLGIYKSDLDAVGGMNTQEFTNRWGGEDWELLDRIVEAGLEVDRLHLRHFFHYHHSKRGMWNHRTRRST